jgi:hypothetical protein
LTRGPMVCADLLYLKWDDRVAPLPDFAATPFSLPNVPYAHYIRRLPSRLASPSISVDTLYEELSNAFLSALDLAILAIRHDPIEHPSGPPSVRIITTYPLHDSSRAPKCD